MVLLCLLIIGQSITLECGQVESILPFSYNWKLHGDLIDDEYSNTLTINNATSTNAGVYTCIVTCLLYTSPSPRDGLLSRMPSSA